MIAVEETMQLLNKKKKEKLKDLVRKGEDNVASTESLMLQENIAERENGRTFKKTKSK